MFKITKEDLYGYIGGTIFSLFLFFAIMYCTSAKNNNIGLHDSKHEGHDCKCHVRLSK